jgi:hypothetical protein
MSKDKRFNAVLSEKRMTKLKNYAESRDRKMTVLFEDWIDSLPEVAVEK